MMQSPTLRTWLLLLATVFAEASATLLLKLSDGFQRIAPGLMSFAVYALVLFLFSHVLARIPASVAYTVWAGLGTLLLILSGWVFFDEAMTFHNLAGIALIVVGVVMINRHRASAS
ncbi:multidrug efflux SMR transporter [Lampropedia puyangensis]|uniref:Multidrug efflux SMR transporter n=1 Tax=Lampropedia puyangensis TaxID=1330072 RepID=A0A4S8EV12_9BURK|nr:multidrug efflux SMR transporter [Lampropedia puyangensis]THT98719.1 multidrug efflux SMR transporter [Lampropedia puyangensis]